MAKHRETASHFKRDTLKRDFLPAVEAVVDDWVVHGGAHGQPHDGQVDLLDVALFE